MYVRTRWPTLTEEEALTPRPLRELGRVRYPDNDQVTQYLTRSDLTETSKVDIRSPSATCPKVTLD